MNEARRFCREKLRECQFRKGYARCLENERLEWDETLTLNECESK